MIFALAITATLAFAGSVVALLISPPIMWSDPAAAPFLLQQTIAICVLGLLWAEVWR